jgi:exopolysaccharide biosynthesis polyprenyl glycosylphosphotransferase
VNRIIARGFDRHVAVHMLADIRDLVMPRQVRLDELGGRAYVGFDLTPKVSWLKRWMDVLGSVVALLLLSPIMLSVAVLIKLESEGPIFYRATRVGKDGKTFGMIKFRSMRRDADKLLASLMASNEADGPIFKMKSDPRITKVGAVIRRLSIDELPQIFNVLMGHMSLVGPRPPIPAEVEKYDDWHHGRLRAVPGMTGLWQVSGRSEVSFQDMVRLDLRYIRNWSVGLDLEIIWRTIPAVLKSRGAY